MISVDQIIKKLGKEIEGKNRLEFIQSYEEVLLDNIEQSLTSKMFLQIPMKNILSILSQAIFDESNINILIKVIKNIVNVHREEPETLQILHYLKKENLPDLNFQECISIFECFTNSYICCRLCELSKLPEAVDWEYICKEKEQEIESLQTELNEMKNKTNYNKALKSPNTQEYQNLIHSDEGNVFVKGFGEDIEPLQLLDIFQNYGEVISCEVPLNPGGKNKGFGFVNFRQPSDAERAIEKLNGATINGKKITVEKCKKKNHPQSNGLDTYTNGSVREGKVLEVSPAHMKQLQPHQEPKYQTKNLIQIGSQKQPQPFKQPKNQTKNLIQIGSQKQPQLNKQSPTNSRFREEFSGDKLTQPTKQKQSSQSTDTPFEDFSYIGYQNRLQPPPPFQLGTNRIIQQNTSQAFDYQFPLFNLSGSPQPQPINQNYQSNSNGNQFIDFSQFYIGKSHFK